MGELKNIAESGQLWELISLQSFVKNTHNFAQSCVNSPRISEKFSFEKKLNKKMVKKAKNMFLLFGKVKLGVKNCLGKCKNICLQLLFNKTIKDGDISP